MLHEEIIYVGKYKINYIKVGHGEHSVFCMPGALGSIWTDFEAQVEGFDTEKFTLIVWDAPGYGKSRPPEREFHTDYYAQDVDIAYEFMKALNIPKFSIMGWCYGGVSSILLAARYPEAVHKLVVWGARSHIQQHEIDYYKKGLELKHWSLRMIEPKIQIYGEERLEKLWTRVVNAMETLYHTNNGVVIPVDVLNKVSCPTLIFHGENDPLIDKTTMHALRDKLRGSRLHIYPEGKHNVHQKFAEDFNRRVRDFLLED